MWKIPSIFFTLVIFTNQVSQAFLAPVSASAPLFVARQLRAGSQDTPETLPDFKTAEDYLKYMESVSALPKGFSTGTADGTFVSVEAPSLGNLKIRGTIIYVSSGPTDNWAACYTSNKVRLLSFVPLDSSFFSWIGLDLFHSSNFLCSYTFCVRVCFYKTIVPRISCQSGKKAIGCRWPHSGHCH
jgi:hypothetical protein